MIDFMLRTLESMEWLTGKPFWMAMVLFVVMPSVGVHFAHGDFVLGCFLMLLQVPWFLTKVAPAMDAYSAYLDYREEFDKMKKNSG